MASYQKAIFPMKYMNVSQSYEQGNHIYHWMNADKGRADYPIDICGADGGQDVLVAPTDCKITMIEAKNSKNWTNKMIIVSTCKVDTPKYGKTQVFFKFVHFPYSNVKKYDLKIGKTFKQGEPICTEGKDNFSTGNHIHLTCGVGYADKSVPNRNQVYVANGDNKYPESIMYVDKDFTTRIIKDGKIKWKYFKEEVKVYYKKYTGKSTSIVDALKAIKVDSSFSHRKKIAKANGIKLYTGLPSQNKKMLELLKKGKLVKEG